jgi:hypothetical protein
VPIDLSAVENGIWDSSLFVFQYSDVLWRAAYCVAGTVWVWARHVCAAVHADGEMLLIVWPNEVRSVVCVCVGGGGGAENQTWRRVGRSQ